MLASSAWHPLGARPNPTPACSSQGAAVSSVRVAHFRASHCGVPGEIIVAGGRGHCKLRGAAPAGLLLRLRLRALLPAPEDEEHGEGKDEDSGGHKRKHLCCNKECCVRLAPEAACGAQGRGRVSCGASAKQAASHPTTQLHGPPVDRLSVAGPKQTFSRCPGPCACVISTPGRASPVPAPAASGPPPQRAHPPAPTPCMPTAPRSGRSRRG